VYSGAQAAQHEKQTAHLQRAVRLIIPSDAEYDSFVRDSFPALYNSTSFQKVKPLTVLVVNRNKLAVRAYSVQWTVISASGTKHVFNKDVVIPLSRNSSYTARTPVLQAGEIRLVSPLFEWSLSRPRYHPKDRLVSPLLDVLSQQPAFKDFGTTDTIKSSIDSVIFDDGTSAGPDSGHLAYRIGKERDAEHDEGVSVLRLISANATDAQIKNVLQFHSAWSGHTDDERAAFRAVRGQEAKLLLAYFSLYGRNALADKAKQLQAMQRTQITKKVW
jgi:hypothetical protein